MPRILFWIVLFGAIWWLWRRAKIALLRAATSVMANAAQRQSGTAAPAAVQLEPMVRCAYCGAHSPRSDTVSLYREHFCNDEHARRYASGERQTEPQ